MNKRNSILQLILCILVFGTSGYQLGYKHGSNDAASLGDSIINQIVTDSKSRGIAALECSFYFQEQYDGKSSTVFVRRSNSMIISDTVSLCSLDIETMNRDNAKLNRDRVHFYLRFKDSDRTQLETYSEITEQEYDNASLVHNTRTRRQAVKTAVELANK